MNSIYKILSNITRSIVKDANIRISFICMLLIIITATQLMTYNIVGITYKYNIGDIAAEDIKVHKEIHYINETETEMAKKKAAQSVPLVFDKDTSILLDRLKSIGVLFNHIITTLEENPPLGTDDLTFQILSLKKKLPRYLQYKDSVLQELLSQSDPEKLKKTIYKILIYIFDNNELGIIENEFENPLDIDTINITVRKIKASDNTEEISRTIYDLETVDSIAKKLYKICYSIAPNLPGKTLNAVVYIVRNNLRPNLRFNLEETKRRINEKVRSVKPVKGVLKKGQNIVREGDTITTEILKKIKILNRHASSSNINYILGIFLIQIIFLIIFSYFIIKYKNVFISTRETSFIIFSVILLFMVYTFFILRQKYNFINDYNFVLLLPIPFVTMIISVLYNVYLSLVIGMYAVFFTSVMAGGELSTIILDFSSAVVGSYINVDVEKRTDFLRGGFILGFMNAVIVVSLSFMKGIPVVNSGKDIALAFANGIINAILVLGIFPIYESLFGITTKFKLFELSDLNAKIFKNMLVQAPGTYNHSLIVSTMAEAACNDIGANHLLARVGAYYHDIGKIENYGIYIENRVTDPRVKELSSKEYSKLIISHVQKGVELARKNGLPETVIKFIREHHGTSTMTFFYHQALENAEKTKGMEEVDKSDFQYPGPKPQSKETAIVMLADSVEAASRTLQNPNKVSIEGLVRKIIYNKLNEGELESSDLSMSDLKRIQRSFMRILNGIFHSRIEYPETEDVKELEQKIINNGKKRKS